MLYAVQFLKLSELGKGTFTVRQLDDLLPDLPKVRSTEGFLQIRLNITQPIDILRLYFRGNKFEDLCNSKLDVYLLHP